MKTWSLLTSLAALLFLAGFSWLGAPPPLSRAARATVLDSAAPDPARPLQRYRQSEPTHWRSVVLVR